MNTRKDKIDLYDFDGTINTTGLNSFPFGLDKLRDDADITDLITPGLAMVMKKQLEQHTKLYIVSNHPFQCVIRYFLTKMLGESAAKTIDIFTPRPEEVLTGSQDKSFLLQQDESDKDYAKRILDELQQLNQKQPVYIQIYDKLAFIQSIIKIHGEDAVYFYIDDRVSLLEDALQRFTINLLTIPAIQGQVNATPDFVKLLNETINCEFADKTHGMLLPGRYQHFIREKKRAEGHYSNVYEARLINYNRVTHVAKAFKPTVKIEDVLNELDLTSYVISHLIGNTATAQYHVGLVDMGQSQILMQPKIGERNLLEKLKSLHAKSILTFEMKMALMIKVIKALSDLHFLKIVHGDPTLSNFVSDKNGDIFLIDYGKASFFVDAKNNNRSNGFSPNDQAPDEIMSYETDVFLLAKTLQMILINQHNMECGYVEFEDDEPVQGEDLHEFNEKLLQEIEDEATIPVEVKPALKTLLLSMRAADPNARPMLLTGDNNVYNALLAICPKALFVLSFQQSARFFHPQNTLFPIMQPLQIEANRGSKNTFRPQ